MQSSLKARVKPNWPHTERTITTFSWKITKTHRLHQVDPLEHKETKLEAGMALLPREQEPHHHQAFWAELHLNLNLLDHQAPLIRRHRLEQQAPMVVQANLDPTTLLLKEQIKARQTARHPRLRKLTLKDTILKTSKVPRLRQRVLEPMTMFTDHRSAM